MENIIAIEDRKFLIFDSIENENDINTTDTVIDNKKYSVESTNSDIELYYITAKPDYEYIGYAIEV